MENLGTAKGYIDLDLGGMTSSIKSAVQELDKIEDASKRADSEMELLQSTSEQTGNAFEQAGQRAKTLYTQLESAKSKVQVYKREMELLKTQIEASKTAQEKLANTIADTKSKYEAAQKVVDDLEQKYKESKETLEALKDSNDANAEAIQKAKEETAKYAQELQKAKQRAQDYSRDISDLENKQSQLDREMEIGEKKLEEFGTAANYAQADVNKLSIELANVRSTAQQFGQYMEDAGEKLEAVGGKLQSVGGKLSAGVTAPLVAAGTAAVKLAGDVEDSAAKLATIADTSLVPLEAMQDAARTISDETATAITDINEGMYQYISATGDTVGASEAAGIAAKAAKAGFTDMSTAVDGATSVMNAYGLSGSEAMQQVVDMMMQTQNKGKTTFGELAQYVGQVVPIASQAGMSMEEFFGAVAALTGSGIQTSQAMTGLKAALSNIIKPSTEAEEAAAALGLQWNAAALEEKGFSGMLSELKESIANVAPEYAKLADDMFANRAEVINLETANEDLQTQMDEVAKNAGKSSDEYKKLKEQYDTNKEAIKALDKESESLNEQMEFMASAAESPLSAYAQLFGSVEGLNSVMVLASEDGGQKWLEFTEAIGNSEGTLNKAFGTVTSTNAEKLRNSLNRMKNTAVDLGNTIAPVVADVVDGVADLVQKFSELDEEQQEMIIKAAGIAAATGPVLSVAGKATSVIGGVTSGIGGLIKKASEVKGVGDTVAGAAGTATSALGASGLSGVLSNLIGPAGLAVLGASAIAGIGIALEVAHQKAVDNDLAEHFGNVKLSAEEAEEVAKRITDTPWTATLDLYSTAISDLENIEEQIGSTVENLNKTQWKIQTGIELTDEEKESYRNNIESFVSEIQEYVEAQHYTTSLAIQTVFGDGSDVEDYANGVYGGINEELTNLGEELSSLVNTAFEENMLDDESMRQLIQDKQKEIQDILDELSQARFDVEMQNIVSTIPDGSLTKESFQKVQKELTDEMQTRKEEIEQAKIDVMVPYQLQYNRGEIDQAEFDEAVKNTTLEAAERMAEVDLQGIKYEIKTITGTYTEANDEAAEKYVEDLKDTFQSNIDKLTDGSLSYENFFANMEYDMSSGYAGLTDKQQAAVQKLLAEMVPQQEELEAIAAQYKAAGEEIPASVAEGISSIEKLQAMTGNMDAAYSLLADEVANSPELQEAINAAYATGGMIPYQLADAMQEKYPEIYDATVGVFERLSEGADLSREDLATIFDSAGVEGADSLIDALDGKSGDVQQKAIDLLKQIQDADEISRPVLIDRLKECGVAIDDAIIDGMVKNQKNVNEQAMDTVEGVRDIVDGAYGGTIEVKTNSPEDAADNFWIRFMNRIRSKQSIPISVSNGYSGYSSYRYSPYSISGLLSDTPIMAVPNSDNPADIMPLASPVFDQENDIMAIADTSRYANYEFAGIGNSNNGNGVDLAEAIAKRLESTLRNAPINNTVEVQMEDGDVYIDGEKAGRKLAPTISRIQARRV